MRLIAYAAVLLMGLAGMAAAQESGTSGQTGTSTTSGAAATTTSQPTSSQPASGQTIPTVPPVPPASTTQPAAPAPAAAQPAASQPAASQPGTSDQGSGTGTSGNTTGSQPAGVDQGSGTGTGSSQGTTAPAQENATPPPPPPLNPAIDAQAKLLLQKLTAKQLDPRLAAMPLEDWFAQQIGKRAEIDWTTGDCSDESDYSGSGSGDTGGSSGASYDPTLCTEGQALFYGPDGKASLDRYVVLQITVGSRQNGINRDPSTYGPDAVTIFVFDGSATRTLSRLGDLPAALESMN